MSLELLQNMTHQNASSSRPQWLIENVKTRKVLKRAYSPISPASTLSQQDESDTVQLSPINHSYSDWQLRGLFNKARRLNDCCPD